MTTLPNRLAQATKAKLCTVQADFALAGRAIGFIFVRPFYAQDLVQQMDEIGVKSLGIVLLTGFFRGMVLALQIEEVFAGPARESHRLAQNVVLLAAMSASERTAPGANGAAHAQREFGRLGLVHRLERWLTEIVVSPDVVSTQ